MNDKKDLSLIFVNGKKGMSIIEKIKQNIEIEEIDLNYAIIKHV